MVQEAQRGITWRACLPALALLAAGLCPLAWQSFAPRAGTRQVMTILPGSPGAAALLAGMPDAVIRGPGGLPNSWIVTSDRPRLAQRLRAGGAWLILNADGAAGQCAPPADKL